MAVADPDDYRMIPGPYYGAFDLDVGVHTGVQILPVYLNDLNNMSVNGDLLEAAYQQESKRVTSMLITNPDNPIGKCYSKQDLETFFIFASSHHMHIIFDEIYALSSYGHLLDNTTKDDPFISVLSLPYKDFIDPSFVHVVYGMSKDFSVNGFRVGYIVDQFNEPLKRTLVRSSAFSYISTITDRLFVNMFSDEKWIDEYLMENRQALATSYSKTTEFLKLHKIDYIAAEAGPFFLIDIRSGCEKATFEYEKELWHRMINHGVYLAPSFAFHAKEPGFFRLTFSLPWSLLEIGLNRLVKVLVNGD